MDYSDRTSDTDSEPSSSQAPIIAHTKDGEKRQYHNVLEQRRRNVLKNSFNVLWSVIPSLSKKKLTVNNNKNRASRAKILKRAIKCIHNAELKRPSRLQDIRNLQKDNAFLEEQCKALQRAVKTGDMSNVGSILKSIDEVGQKVYDEESSDTEEEENDDIDDAAEPITDTSSDNDDENIEPEQEEEDPSDTGDYDGDLDSAENSLIGPSLDWSFTYGQENYEPGQIWSVNVCKESESSEDSSSDNE